MAKGNMLQGQATGKVGDIVFMVRNGQQVARVYTSAGGRSGDQASIAVRRQRVRFGAASNQYLLYRNIVRGMYRTGKSTKQSDYNFFVRENVDLLPYLTREENAAGVKCAMPGTFSRGTLGSLNYSIVQTAPSGGNGTWKLANSGIEWPDEWYASTTVQEFKNWLKTIVPNARKVCYCVCILDKQELAIPSGSSWSHTFVRYDVTFDLYEEDPNVANSATIANYFAYYAPDTILSDMFSVENAVTLGGQNWIQITDANNAHQDELSLLYVNVFASNDQVGDCYTSTMTALNAAESDGGLSLYSTLRTNDHRQVAEDSYGYATGVMRTNIQQA